MALFFKPAKRSFVFLNITQFLGALNDNMFKLLVVYMLISFQGIDQASRILAFTGAVFVIPFLVFSSASGVLADRISKRKILVWMKVLEVLVMLLSLAAVFYKSVFGVYALLFLLAAQCSVFGPSKYGIIPEIVATRKISKANGILNSLTYIAIILGTFLASLVADLTNKNFLLSSFFCLVIAIFGLLAVLKIERTLPQRSKQRINPFFFYEIYQTLALAFKRKHLLPAICGSSFFLFMGGYVQLNTIPYAIQSLHLSDVGGGYLFLATAIGIAAGSLVVGKISKDNVDLGISCTAGFFIAFFLILLGFFPKNLFFSIFLLIMLGFFGGLFLIPFDAFIQLKSPENRRGQIIAATNFFSFSGVLIASILLWFVNDFLSLKAKDGFLILGLITLVFNLVNTGRLSDLFFSYLVRKILSKFYLFEINRAIPPRSAIILKKFSWIDALSLFRANPNLKVLVQAKKYREFPFFDILTDTLAIIPKKKLNAQTIQHKADKIQDSKNTVFCLLFKKKIDPSILEERFEHLFYLETIRVRLVKKKFFFKRRKTLIKAVLEEIPRQTQFASKTLPSSSFGPAENQVLPNEEKPLS
ncbi:MAG: MFS transporter [Parachlamydiales bacterium]|jgi:acyl-[acyl-carrier-protein]-phospholipid O-acyltransferase/long-chain-fatty-acid--[acyl-carrier-protein] ligase